MRVVSIEASPCPLSRLDILVPSIPLEGLVIMGPLVVPVKWSEHGEGGAD